MSQRIERVQKLARQVLGESIQTLKDPRVGFATVTRVKVSGDLRHARVYVSVLGDQQQQEASLEGLKSAAPHLKTELGRQVRLKYVPELTFEIDHGPETAERIEELLHRLHEEHEHEEHRHEHEPYGDEHEQE